MTEKNDFSGNWTYRSFINNPEIDAPADDVVFATGDLKLEAGSVELGTGGTSESDVGGSEISGQILFGSLPLTVSGTANFGSPSTIQFRATGVEGALTAGWIYDFAGCRALSWPEGVEQRPAIVGTVIRTVPHKAVRGEEVRPAGSTFSFIAVLRDHPAGS